MPGVQERLAAAAPALADLDRRRPVAPAARLRCNVALHAVGLPSPSAPLAAWRQAQRGPRLGASAAEPGGAAAAGAREGCCSLADEATALSGETQTNIAARGEANDLINNCMGSSFLQTTAAVDACKLVVEVDMSSVDRDIAYSFLSEGEDPASGQVTGILS